MPASAVEDAIRAAGGDLLWSVRLFDVYRGQGVADGTRSLAYTLRLQAADRTLTDADVAAVRQQIIDAVQSQLPATLARLSDPRREACEARRSHSCGIVPAEAARDAAVSRLRQHEVDVAELVPAVALSASARRRSCLEERRGRRRLP